MEEQKLHIEALSRRQFIDRMGQWGKHALFASVGLSILGNCAGEGAPQEDLDPPFICDGVCTSNFLPPFDTTTTSGTIVYLVFSGFNNETNPQFTGYNVWYGNPTTIKNNHKAGNRNLVLFQSGTDNLNLVSMGVGPFPSYVTAATSNQTSFVGLTISGVTPAVGNYLYVTAYSLIDDVDSVLSNGYNIL